MALNANALNNAKKLVFDPEDDKKIVKMMENVPKKAYWIAGHGNQEQSTWIVPNDSIIIVKSLPGIAVGSGDHMDYMEKWLKLNPEIVKSPLLHISELRKSFGSVAIYTPGMECPTFNYSLPNTSDSDYYEFLSGALDFDIITKFYEKHRSHYLAFNNMNKKMDTLTLLDKCKYIAHQFIHSIYPTRNDVLSFLKNAIKDHSVDRFGTSIEGLFKLVGWNYSRTQEELCKEKPGVYYNFVCRNVPDIDIQLNINTNKWHRPLINSNKLVGSKNNGIKYIRNQLLSETLLQRKPHTRKAYLENQITKSIKGYTQKAAIKKEMKDITKLIDDKTKKIEKNEDIIDFCKTEIDEATLELNTYKDILFNELNNTTKSSIDDLENEINRQTHAITYYIHEIEELKIEIEGYKNDYKKLENLLKKLKGGNYTKRNRKRYHSSKK
jgi:hypothetical protein